MQILRHPQERLLSRIFSVFPVTKHAQAQAIDHSAISRKQLDKRRLLAFQALADQTTDFTTQGNPPRTSMLTRLRARWFQ
jgi:hypothetical protein